MTFHLPPSGPQSPASGLYARFTSNPADPIRLVPFRTVLADEIERLITMLDEIDGDADLEPNGDERDCDLADAGTDREGDHSDLEPSLGSLNGTSPFQGFYSPDLRQTNWAGGGRADAEGPGNEDDEDGGDDEPDDPQEPSLGSLEQVDQTAWGDHVNQALSWNIDDGELCLKVPGRRRQRQTPHGEAREIFPGVNLRLIETKKVW